MQSICKTLDIRIQELLTGQRQQEAPRAEDYAALILDIANREKAEKAKRLNWYFLPGAALLAAALLTALPYLPPSLLAPACIPAVIGLLFLLWGLYQNNLHPSITKKELRVLVENEQQLAMKDGGEMLQFTKKYQRTHKPQHAKAFAKIAEGLEAGEYAVFSMIADSYSVNGHPEIWHIALAVTDRRVLLCGESVRGRLSTCYIAEDFPRTDLRSLKQQKQKLTLQLSRDTVVIRGSDLESAAHHLRQILE